MLRLLLLYQIKFFFPGNVQHDELQKMECTKENIKKQRTDIFNLKKENLEDMDHRNNNEEKINSLFSVDKFFYCISNI